MRLNKDLLPISDSLTDNVIKGLNDTAFCHYINEIFLEKNQNIVLLTPSQAIGLVRTLLI